eukprot:3045913-Prymnesium_polylepis.1
MPSRPLCSPYVCPLAPIPHPRFASRSSGARRSPPPLAPQTRFVGMLTEDRAQTSMSYVEFLCHVHRQIQQKFQN